MHRIYLPLFLSIFLAWCAAAPAITAVPEQPQQRQCPPLPTLSDNATTAERTAFVRRVVQMYALCAKGI